MSQPQQKQLVREITGAAFCTRVGPANSMEGELNFVSTQNAEIVPERHEQLGPGLRLKWKGQEYIGQSIFVPIGNVARVTYREREQQKENKPQ